MLQTNRKQHKLELLYPGAASSHQIPYFSSGISAGFPSPAEDFKENRISLDKELINDAEATFFARVNGDSMVGAGMNDGDLLVIDKSIEPYDGCIAVCFIDGDFTVKRIKKEKNCVILVPENPKYEPIEINGENTLVIWGVVTYVIKNIQKNK